MKIIILFALVAVAVAAPQAPTEPIAILRSESEIGPNGDFQYAYETANGIAAQATGQLKDVGAEQPALTIDGQFSYQGEEGPIQLSYTADENGYRPQGSHLPTPPPVPADIQKALDFLATAQPQPENQ